MPSVLGHLMDVFRITTSIVKPPNVVEQSPEVMGPVILQDSAHSQELTRSSWIPPFINTLWKPTCFRFGTASSVDTAAFQTMASQLKAIGLSRMGSSSYFERGPFVVHISDEGHPKIFRDFLCGEDLESVKAICYDIAEFSLGDKSIMVLQQTWWKQIGYDRGIFWGGGPIRDFKVFDGIRSKPLHEQLLLVGFQADPSQPGVFTLTEEDIQYGVKEAKEIVAMLKGNTLKKMVVAMSNDVQERLSSESHFVRYETTAKDFADDISHPLLVIESRGIEITVSDFGDVYDQRLLLPLEAYSAETLNIEYGTEEKDVVTGFVYAGVNSTETIQGLRGKELNGISVSDLEKRMRPRQLSERGFLGNEESLIDILAEDNDWVIAHGLTHQALANVLHLFSAPPLLNELRTDEKEVIYLGQRYGIKSNFWMGFQTSPFESDIYSAPYVRGGVTNFDVHVKNVTTGQKISFSGLLPFLIERYGFYEGKGTSYRTSPQQIAEMFKLGS